MRRRTSLESKLSLAQRSLADARNAPSAERKKKDKEQDLLNLSRKRAEAVKAAMVRPPFHLFQNNVYMVCWVEHHSPDTCHSEGHDDDWTEVLVVVC